MTKSEKPASQLYGESKRNKIENVGRCRVEDTLEVNLLSNWKWGKIPADYKETIDKRTISAR